MSYVIYHKDTTYILRDYWYHKGYETETAAKAALTRFCKRDKLNRNDYAIAGDATFYASIEKKVVKKNLMSGKDMEPMGVNEPACTDPSTETYWSM